MHVAVVGNPGSWYGRQLQTAAQEQGHRCSRIDFRQLTGQVAGSNSRLVSNDVDLEQVDVLISPTSPTVAFSLGARTENPLAMYVSDLLTIPSCMAGLPGLSIPCGLSEGLPVGLQLIGPQFSENALFDVGHALENALGFDSVPTRLRAAA